MGTKNWTRSRPILPTLIDSTRAPALRQRRILHERTDKGSCRAPVVLIGCNIHHAAVVGALELHAYDVVYIFTTTARWNSRFHRPCRKRVQTDWTQLKEPWWTIFRCTAVCRTPSSLLGAVRRKVTGCRSSRNNKSIRLPLVGTTNNVGTVRMICNFKLINNDLSD